MRRRRIFPNEVTFGAAVAACEKAGEWKFALNFISLAREAGLVGGLLTISSAISACEKSTAWLAATSLAQMSRRMKPDVVTFSAELSCNEKANQWQRSFNILDRMSICGVSPGIITLNAAVSSCELTGQWQRAMDILSRCCDLTPDVVSFSATVSSSGASGKWPEALALFAKMNPAAVLANVILCNSLVSACEESGQWENALEVFKKLSCFTSSSVISINAGIAAGGRGSLWQFSAHLLHQLVQETGCRPTIVSFNAALSACAGCKKWRAVLGITEDFSRCGLEPDAISLNSVAGALERQGRWVGASKLLFEAQKCGERLLGPEVTTIGVAVDSSQRFGSVARAAGVVSHLPDKNELANACYFTYKVGYVICDTTLGPEAAQREMEAGRCNQDFRLTGSDFQRLVLKHYLEGGRPPLEEATWLLTSSDNFQSRTLSECPPMQILANMLYAEALLYLDGASRYGESAELVAQALQQTKRVQTEVLNALSHTWPLDIATHRFQETFLTVDGVAKQATLATSPSEKESVHLALCRCSENLDWFVSLLNEIGSQPHLDLVIHLYETCGADEGTQELQELQAAVFGHVKRHDVPVVELGGTSASSDCTTHLVLKHLLGHGNDVKTLPKFLLFLPSAAPLEAEEQLYKVVFKSITSRTLDVDFMALGLTRSPPISLNACQKDLIQSQVLNIQNYPLGYEGPRFLVSSQRLRDSMNQVRSLISTFEQPPPHCTLEQLEIAVANWWHIVFGEAAQLPIRADDDRLPMFVRVSDGPSGFSRTRMPKSSDYLSWAAIGLHN